MRYQILVQFHGVYNIDIDGVYREKKQTQMQVGMLLWKQDNFFFLL